MRPCSLRRSDDMKIATLGFDSDILEFVRVIERSPSHMLAGCFDMGDGSSAMAKVTPASFANESWEALLTDNVADLIIVASRPRSSSAIELRDNQLRKIAQGTTPLLLVQPSCQMIVAFELEMIRQDSNCLMIPFHRLLFDPHYDIAKNMVQASNDAALGQVEQLVWDRQSTARDRRSVLEVFTRDAEILRDLLGGVTHVSAMGSSDTDAGFANLGVHLTGQANRLARWSIGPVQDQAGAKLTLVGSGGSAVLQMPDEGDNVVLVHGEPVKAPSDSPFARALQSVEASKRSQTADSLPSWDDACRALELEDAVERSARRGRTIELHNEMVTERETFKSMMAAGGCGLLLWVLMLLLIAGVVEGLQLPFRDSLLWRLWPLYLFAPLGIFLLMQLLQLAVAKPDRKSNESGTVDETE